MGVVDDDEDDIIDILGTVFLLDEDPDEDPVVGIETDDEEYFVAEGHYGDELRDFEGEMVKASGTVEVDDAGSSWLYLTSFDLADGD